MFILIKIDQTQIRKLNDTPSLQNMGQSGGSMVHEDLTPSRGWNDKKMCGILRNLFWEVFFLTTCCNYTNNVWHCGASVVVFTCENLLPHIWGSMACPVPLVATRSKRGTFPSGFNSYHCRIWEVLENEMRSMSTNIVLALRRSC
jgi:hypothetical protein